ncbi:MAG: Amino acid transporter [Gammaproteobacteria bacterium]|jgi:amino acid transporter|nr:Amino acid transporter [Gammaproteobacteria bacterium]
MENFKAIPKKVLGVFSLVMINVIAVDSLRALPATAHLGFSIVFYYLAAGLMFFIPSALIAAELATTWPKTGGIYVWAKAAFNKETAFLLVSLQWIYNVCWYPTILSLMAAILAYCIKPELAHHTTYMFFTITGLFWLILGINSLGLKCSSYLTSFSAVIGTLVPIGFVIVLGTIWLISGHHSEIHFSVKTFFPDLSHINTLAFFTSVLFSLMGMEMSAIHAQEVKNPQSDYPKALLISALLILGSFIFASLAIAVVIPVKNLSVVTGLLEAYRLFFVSFHMQWMMPVLAILMIVGGAGGVGAWMLGPVKALLVAGQDGLIPKPLAKLNPFQAPFRLLLLQGLVFMILTSAFIFMPSVNAGFWLLSDLASQISLIFYCGFFIVAIRLRYSHPEIKRPFKVPLGKYGIWLCGISGMACCLFTLSVGFLPPPGISFGSLMRFESFLVLGIIFACSLPFFISKSRVISHGL